MSQFYALMHDNTVKYISLKEEIVTDVRNLFINGGAILKPEGIEEDVFDGNIVSRNGENIRRRGIFPWMPLHWPSQIS